MKSDLSGRRVALLGQRPFLLPALMFALSTALSACVTINIYFPAAAAEKAAETFIDDIWQLQESPGQNDPQ
ncbi:MAG: hypothetical protein FWH15_08520 [Betaproteobacteria bacterium]|nr:hypothetical protein [Betaproteobacteria bacterium]